VQVGDVNLFVQGGRTRKRESMPFTSLAALLFSSVLERRIACLNIQTTTTSIVTPLHA